MTITGTGFGPSKDVSKVRFYGMTTDPEIVSWSDTAIEAVVPEGAGTGPLTVTVGGVAVDSSPFIKNRTVQLTDSEGHITSYTSAILGGTWVLTDVSGPGCSSCNYRGNQQKTHDGMGNVLTSTDALGRTTTYTYDLNNNLLTSSVALDQNTTVSSHYTYNSFGEVLTATDPLGHVTTNTYDAKGNLLTTTTPSPDGTTAGSTTSFTYAANGELLTITDPLNHVTTLTYNAAGLVETVTDPQSHVTHYEYDLRGNRTAVVDALGNRTTFEYDLRNRLTKVTYPDLTHTDFAYDTRGRRTSVTDANGKVTGYAYDDADRLTSVTDAAQNLTSYAYDTENNLTSITDALGRSTGFSYDNMGRVVQTTFPSTLTETYSYDDVGNLLSKTDRKGQTISYSYDALDRLTRKQYSDSTGVDYGYDLAGRLLTASDLTGSYAFNYDNLGRLTSTATQYLFLTGRTFTNQYSYDSASNRVGYTDPEGTASSYGYDALNRLTTLNSGLAGQFSFGYDELSRRTSLTRPNGVVTSYSYDNLSRLLSVLHKAGGTTVIDGATYTLDNAGNRTAKTNQLTGTQENYAYDAIYQLTQVTQQVNGTPITTENYTYDNVGNRTSSLSIPNYTVNESNQLTSTTDASYTYDANGNTLTKTDANGTTTYNWDYENRLTSLVLPGSGGTVSFKYDPFGRRIQKASASATTNFVYDGAGIVEEVDAAGLTGDRYSQGTGIDEPLAMTTAGITSFYQADGLGSVTGLTDSSGSIVQSYTYNSYGNLASSGGSLLNPFRFTGREWDDGAQLYQYRSRYYDQGNGRFLSEDPIKFKGGINFFGYVRNNPENLTDPAGLCPDCKIVVRCWPIETYNLGKVSTWATEHLYGIDAGAKHCFIEFFNSDGHPWGRFSAGPDGKLLHMWPTAQQEVSPDPAEPTMGWPVFYQNAVDCNSLYRMQDVSKLINDQQSRYRPAAQNSNSAVATLLDSIGLAEAIRFLPLGAVGSHVLPLPK